MDFSELSKYCLNKHIPYIGEEKGEILFNLVKKGDYKDILELGTASGYSGCILGSNNAHLTTVDSDHVSIKDAKENFKKYKINAEVYLAEATEFIKTLNQKFDLIFLDFSKKDYVKVIEDCLRLLNENGIIIADNIDSPDCKNFLEKINNYEIKYLRKDLILIKVN